MTIPEQVAIELTNLQRSALRSLLDSAPPGMGLDELLDGVIILGLGALLKHRPLPDLSKAVNDRAQTIPPIGEKRFVGGRVTSDYVGFSVTQEQSAALEEPEARHPLVDDEELERIVLDAGLRALSHDEVAQLCLESATWPHAERGN